MKLGKINKKFLLTIFFILKFSYLLAEEKIKSVPLINLEELSPTFEEDKDQLDEIDDKNSNITSNTTVENEEKSNTNDKIVINLTTLNKITAKTSFIKIPIGDKKLFGSLEIKGLKCQFIEDSNLSDTIAYLQIKDLSKKDNDRVFLFNGWTFASNPTFQSIDHPIYDLWITGCENI
tara:strand:- start:53 stop:583 length:531 start_codon:yes stop_codon:yes gene_type:complete